jgi:hypothetical protein
MRLNGNIVIENQCNQNKEAVGASVQIQLPRAKIIGNK